MNVTKTYLPDLKDYVALLEQNWESGWVTNHGKHVTLLAEQLSSYLDAKHICLVNNGTIALQIAIKSLDLKGEVITTPFSYVATTSSLVWENCKPIFADIDPESLCICPQKIKEKITKDTCAILATHVYGNSCAVHEIEEIAKSHNLKVIYDAAHAFGVRLKGTPLTNFGEMSTLSFHATKLFHTVEGGAIVTNSDELSEKVSYMRNFGHKGYEGFWGIGINGKMSEMHGAMGLCNLPVVDALIAERKLISGWYDVALSGLQKQVLAEDLDYNFAYYPVIFDHEKQLQNVMGLLKKHDIFPRRYFYPALNQLPYINTQRCPVAEDIAKRILCLPFFNGMTHDEVKRVSNLVMQCL